MISAIDTMDYCNTAIPLTISPIDTKDSAINAIPFTITSFDTMDFKKTAIYLTIRLLYTNSRIYVNKVAFKSLSSIISYIQI